MKLLGIALSALLLLLAGHSTAADTPPDGDQIDKQLSRLIEQLGDNQFAVRQRAQQELLKFGFEAFDALSEAESNDDPEIAMQAGYLVRQVRAQWTTEKDPRQIQQILKDYEALTDDRRVLRIKQLADLPNDQGLEWLCRVVRFERSMVLSKQAALEIIQHDVGPDEAAWTKRSETINRVLKRGKRPGAKWLLAHIQAQSDPAGALEKWTALAAAERQTLEQHPQETQNQVVREMLRRQVELLDRLGRTEETWDVMRQMVQCERGDSTSLTELVEWLVKRKAWPVIDEAAARFSASFEIDSLLMYTLCEARMAQGNRELAEQTAQRAAKLSGDSPAEHAAVAERLIDRGLIEWADRELRQIIAIGPLGAPTDISARAYLADSLHERGRDQEGGEILKTLLDAADTDPNVLQRVRGSGRGDFNTNLIRANMNFYFSVDAATRGDTAKQREYLDKAFEQHPGNVEVLIGMYRQVGQDPQKRGEIVKQVKEVIELCRAKIEDEPDAPSSYNQIAWLIANTEGDRDEAVRLSHKSVELARAAGESPKRIGGLLDTLAHCYFAKKDFESAVKYQSEAAKLDPYTPTIGRQLIKFRQALEEQRAAAPK